ncbi:ATP-binding protein [Streptomyces sp. NPDC039022]|uniref:ATP-binding protein n=1 Tax=unclassified Streptomyces TaxID=2593676 RepID=UPI003410690C
MYDTETLRRPAPPTTVVEGDTPAGIRDARRAAHTFAERLAPAHDAALTDTLVLVVCELVTNAPRHGGGRYRLELTATPDSVTASVSDPSPLHPRERTPNLTGDSGGFGWPMIRQLSRHITITSGPGSGKTIRVRLPR